MFEVFFHHVWNLWQGTGIPVGILTVCFKKHIVEGKVHELYTDSTQEGSGVLKWPMKWQCEEPTYAVLVKFSLLKSSYFQELTAIDTSHFVLCKGNLKFKTREQSYHFHWKSYKSHRSTKSSISPLQIKVVACKIGF